MSLEEEPRRSGRRRRCRASAMNVNYKKLAGEIEDDDDHLYTTTTTNNNANPFNDDDNGSTNTYGPAATTMAQYYANRHIPHILHRTFDSTDSIIQIVTDGSKLTASALKSSTDDLAISKPIVVTDTPESLGMTVPKPQYPPNSTVRHYFQQNNVTVRDIAQIIGVGHAVTVMDVKHQEELEGWTLGDLMDYFEDEDRLHSVEEQKQWLDWWMEDVKRLKLMSQHGEEKVEVPPPPPPPPKLSKTQNQQHRVLNQISLEFSHTPLITQATSPQFVRDLDWIDNIWPPSLKSLGDYPRVQYYCLTSTSGCYTDFHVDFGGTAVWYHILSGSKVFLLVPPYKRNLQMYEEWLCSKNQNDIFYPDLPNVKGVYRVTLTRGQTLVIPTGYIHAVYTPEDSVVIGGNFLHGLDVEGQLDVHCLETRTRVPAKFRFPNFVRMMFYAGADYVGRMRRSSSNGGDGGGEGDDGDLCEAELRGVDRLADALQSWAVQPGGDADRIGSVAHTARECVKQCGCKDVTEMVNLMKKEKQRWLEEHKKRKGKMIKLSLKSDKPKLKLKIATISTVDGAGTAAIARKSETVNVVEPEQLDNENGKNDQLKQDGHEDDEDGPSDFKIVLPPNSLADKSSTIDITTSLNSVPMKRKRTQHVDINPYRGGNRNDQNEDDEWVPGWKKKRKPKKTMKTSSSAVPKRAVTSNAHAIPSQHTTFCNASVKTQPENTATSSNIKLGNVTKKHGFSKHIVAANSSSNRSKAMNRMVSGKMKPSTGGGGGGGGMTARQRLKKRMKF